MWYFIINLLIAFSAIVVHELGHLIAGLVQGFRFELFIVGPLGIKRNQEKIKVYFNTNLQFYGGIASTIPIEDKPENAKKFANVLIAGPLTSLLFAVVFTFLLISFDLKYSKLVNVAALASFGIFLATTIPSKIGLFFSDRKRYQRLTSKGYEREIELIVLRVISVFGRDTSYLNVDENDIDKMIADENYHFFGLYTKLYYQLEKNGEFESVTKATYDKVSKKMSKSIVKFFNKDLEKMKEKKDV